jgi:hypothetical protein
MDGAKCKTEEGLGYYKAKCCKAASAARPQHAQVGRRAEILVSFVGRGRRGIVRNRGQVRGEGDGGEWERVYVRSQGCASHKAQRRKPEATRWKAFHERAFWGKECGSMDTSSRGGGVAA